MDIFITNFILGFILAAEFGQVSVEIFRQGIHFGFKNAILTSLGGAFADFLYLSLSVIGIIVFLDNPDFLKILWIIGGIVLFYIGISGLRKTLKARAEKQKLEQKAKNSNSFTIGFLLNFIHPLNLIWWITILSPIIAREAMIHSRITAYFSGTGIVFGVFAWWIILSIVASFWSKRISQKYLKIVSIISSILLIGFAIWFFYNGIVS